MNDWDEYDYGDEVYSDNGADSEDEWNKDLGGLDMQSEYKDRERAGGIIGCWLTGVDGQPLKTQTPLGRFCLRVDAVSRNINSTCMGFSLPDDQIEILLEKGQELDRVEFKNPTAFVLGYLATARGSRKIAKSLLDNVWTCYKSIGSINKDLSIRKPDIIRYARLWVK